MPRKIFVLSLFLVIFLAACQPTSQNTTSLNSSAASDKSQTVDLENKEKTSIDPDGGLETEESIEREKQEYEAKNNNDDNDNEESKTTSRYQDYSAEAVSRAEAAGHKVVLYFHAPWCPTCQAADQAFKANPDAIPANVVVLKTDYDSQKDLKKKYGVTYQHTFVQIDNDGHMVTKWNSGDVEELKENVK